MFILVTFQFINPSFVDCAFDLASEKPLPGPQTFKLCSMFSSMSFMVLHFIFWSVICSEPTLTRHGKPVLSTFFSLFHTGALSCLKCPLLKRLSLFIRLPFLSFYFCSLFSEAISSHKQRGGGFIKKRWTQWHTCFSGPHTGWQHQAALPGRRSRFFSLVFTAGLKRLEEGVDTISISPGKGLQPDVETPVGDKLRSLVLATLWLQENIEQAHSTPDCVTK